VSKKTRVAAALAVLAAGGASATMIATAQSTSAGGPATARHGGSSCAAGARRPVAVALGYLGLTRMQLVREIRSGRTLAEVAAATPGKSAAGLIDALVSAKAARLTAAVAAGRLPAAKLGGRLAGLRRRVAAAVDRVHRPGAGRRPYLALAADYLGLSRAQLRADLRPGSTLGGIADGTPGRSRAGLIEALLAPAKARLAARVGAGALTAANESKRLAMLTRRVQTIVDRRAHAKRACRVP
jgi:hypothetical protein